MMEKILLGSSYLAQAIVMATIAFAVISTIYYLRYNKKIICQPGWIIKYIFLVYIATVEMTRNQKRCSKGAVKNPLSISFSVRIFFYFLHEP